MFYRIKDNLCNWSLTIPILLLLAVTSSAQIDSFPRTLNQIRFVRGANDPNWAGSDDGARINSAIADLQANSPTQAGTVWVSPGSYQISTTINLNSSNLQLKCLGGSFSFGNGPTCTFKWTGASSGTVITMGQAAALTVGLGLADIFVNANSLAKTCLSITTIQNSIVQNFQCSNYIATAGTGGLLVTVNSAGGTFVNRFENITMSGGVSGANGIWITGSSTLDVGGNVWVNLQSTVTAGAGEAIHTENQDHDNFIHVVAAGGAGGTGLRITCMSTASSTNMCARSLFFFGGIAASGATPYKQDNNSTAFYPTAISIRWDADDIGALPSISNILNGTATMDVDTATATNEGTYRFTQIGGTTFLTSKFLNDGGLSLLRSSASIPQNMLSFDSPGLANQTEDIAWSDNGTAKWAIGLSSASDIWSIFDSAAGQNAIVLNSNSTRLYQSANGNNQLSLSNTGVQSGPLTATASGVSTTLAGTGACASRSGQLGAWNGQVTCTGVTGASTLTITPGFTAPNGFSCWASDITHTLAGSQSTASVTAPVMTFSNVTANDVLTFGCIGY